MTLPLGDFISAGIDISLCPICGKGHLTCIAELHRARDGPV